MAMIRVLFYGRGVWKRQGKYFGTSGRSGEDSEDLQTKLEDLENMIKLKSLQKIAAKADSLRAFEEKAEIYFNTKDKK